VVEVHHDGGERLLGALRVGDHALQRVLHGAGVRHAGERVGRGLALGLGERAQLGEDGAGLRDRVARPAQLAGDERRGALALVVGAAVANRHAGARLGVDARLPDGIGGLEARGLEALLRRRTSASEPGSERSTWRSRSSFASSSLPVIWSASVNSCCSAA
jgi:hypothetical protein